MSRFIKTRMSKMTKSEMKVKIMSMLLELEPSDRIALIESIGKKLRQANSREISKDVAAFAIKTGNKKNVDQYPV